MIREGPFGRSWNWLLRWSASPGVVGPLMAPYLWGRARGRGGEWPGFAGIERLGVIRHDGLGDLMVTTGFLRELRRAAPRARISLVTRPEWVEVMKNCGHIDEVLGFPVQFSRRWMVHRNIAAAWKFARRELWPRRWDAVLVPQAAFSLFESRYLAYFSGVPVRVGRRDAASDPREPGWGLLTRVVETPVGEHEAISCARMLSALGIPAPDPALELNWGAEAEEELARIGLGSSTAGPWVAMGVGASQREKVWPLDRFIEIATRFRRQGWRVVLVGGTDLMESGRRLGEAVVGGVTDLTGRLSLPATAALLSRCRMYVGNDSGPMHVAAAVGTPVVEIVGWPADVPDAVIGTPKRIGPFCAYRRIVQPATTGLVSAIHVERIGVEEVWAAVGSLAKEIPVRAGGNP